MSLSDGDVELEIETCRFKLSSKLDKKAPAFIVDFSNGILKADSRPEATFESYRSLSDSDVSRDSKRYLKHTGDRLTYSGSSFDNRSGSRVAPLRYFVGVHCKRTGKMKLHDASFFHMKPILRTTITATPGATPKSFRENLDDLTTSFGSKTKKRAMSSRLRYAVKDPTVDESLLEDDDSKPSTSKFVTNGTARNSSFMPPINRESQTVEEVFSIDDIISIEEDDALYQMAKELLSEVPIIIDDTYCEYVKSHLDNQPPDVTKMKYLVYINYLIMFQQLGYVEIRKKDPCSAIPEPFKQKFLREFTQVSKYEDGRVVRTLPQVMKDKILAYVLVLTLFIDDFSVNISTLLRSLNKVGVPKLQTLFHALGCHIRNMKSLDETIKFAELKLPLFVMAPKYAKKK